MGNIVIRFALLRFEVAHALYTHRNYDMDIYIANSTDLCIEVIIEDYINEYIK